MANDNRRSHKVKDDENIKSKKKTITPDASPASSSRRSSRETSSGKQTKESSIKENLINTRKSERLEKMKPSDTTPIKDKSKRTREQIITTPMKKYDRRKKANLQSRNSVSPATSNVKSKKEKVVNGGKKRKRVGTCINKGLSKSQQIRTEAESEEKSSEANSSSRDEDTELEKPDSSRSVEHKDDSDDDVSDSNEEESTVKASKRQCKSLDLKEPLNDRFIDLEEDRTTCEAAGLSENLVVESIWDTREMEVSESQAHNSGLQKQKEYFVKYKGLSHIHNHWITETQLLLEAPLLVENYSKNASMKWNEEWTVPHQLLKKRLLLYLVPVCNGQQNTLKALNYRYEWLVQWQGLDDEQATWESENIYVLDSPKGHNLIKEYEKHYGNAKKYASSDDRIEEIPVKLPTVSPGCPPGMDNLHSSYIKNLHDAWNKGQNSIVFDDQERSMRIVLFIMSLKCVTLPFLLITTSGSLSQWESMFLKIASFNSFKVSLEYINEKTSSRLLHVQKEDGQLAFQLLLYPVDAFLTDLNVLKAIKWEAVIIDESQSSEISSHFSHIKSLSTDKRLLVFCGPLGVSNLDVLSLLDCDVITKTELDDISKLKETLSKLIAYECKSSSSKFVEYWVPVQISNLQLEQYCSMLLSNSMALSSCSKTDTTGALHDILNSNRKCCDHPYIVDQSLQAVLTKDLEPAKFLEVGIKASGKLQFLDVTLPELRKRQLRVLILFQPLSGSGKDSTSIGDILDDFVRQRFGEDSYERVDGIGIIPSKKQAALNNFNNKEMGRFIFLLEYRACLPSIKLSSVDTIIIFDSDWNPANDLRALQKIAIDSHSEQIMIFRLYTSLTLEEKILRLAENNVTIDIKLQNLSRSISDALLMWGATYLFKKLDDFHSDLNISSEECWWNEVMEEFFNLISHKCKNKDAGKLIITRVRPICGTYGKNALLPNEPDGEQPHTFWKKLLAGRNPCWKYLSNSTPRQRKIKRPQYFEVSPKKTNIGNDDAGHKRKKITNNISEPVVSNLVIEERENAGEMSFPDLLKLKISKLCEVLMLSEDVKIMVEKFLEYVIDNYRVNKEPENTLHAFLISMCWIGSGMLKHKLDRKQSIALANEHLNFSCKEEEANSVYLKLEPAKEMFLLHTDNQKKPVVLTDSIPEVKIEISDGPPNHDDGVDCNEKGGEVGTINPDTSDAVENKNDNNSVQPLVSPASGQSVPTDLVNRFNSEASPVQPDEQLCLPYRSLGEQQPDSQNPEPPPQVLESSAQVPNQGVTPRGSNLSKGQSSGNHNQGVPRKLSSDPLQAELERLCELKDTVIKCHEAIKQKIKADYEKELAEMIAQMDAKYEVKNEDADAAFQLKKKEVDTCFNRVVMNKVLAETFKSKCQDLSPFNPSEIQVIQSGGIQHLPQFGRSTGVTSSGGQQVTGLQPPLQIVNQTAKLFSATSTRPPSNTNLSTMPTRPPPSTIVPTSTPSKLPFTASATGTPSRPPPSINSITPFSRPSRPPPPTTPTSRPLPNINPTTPSARNLRVTEIRAPAPHIRPFRPSTSVSPHDLVSRRVMPSQHPPSSSLLSQTSARPRPLQTPPPPFPTNHNRQHTQNSPRSLPITSSQPPASVPVPVPAAPPASFQLPPLYSWHPPRTLPAASSSHPQLSLPPTPPVSISRHTGLYNTTSDILSRPALDLLMDIDKQGGFHHPNTSPSPPKFLDLTDFGKEAGGSDLVCLSDDDDDDYDD